MPIFDQGYQHWQGHVSGRAFRWLAITRQGIRAQLAVRGLRIWLYLGLLPAFVLAGFLVLWGLIEQKAGIIAPFLSLLPNLPDVLKDDPAQYRIPIWTIAFNFYFRVQVLFTFMMVVITGPGLISQDLRFNAVPLYLSRPMNRWDYFLGKFGVIAFFVGLTAIAPTLLAYVLGLGFSLDVGVIADTWRVVLGSLAYGLVVVATAGAVMLALSSLSRNSKQVAAMWVAFWIVPNIAAEALENSVKAPWCNLVSYLRNLEGVRLELLGFDDAMQRLTEVFPEFVRQQVNALGQNDPPWTWCAAVLTGLIVVSLCALSLRVRSLDRLK